MSSAAAFSYYKMRRRVVRVVVYVASVSIDACSALPVQTIVVVSVRAVPQVLVLCSVHTICPTFPRFATTSR